MGIHQIGAEREDAMPAACEVKNGKGPTFEAGAFSIRTPSCVVSAGGIVEEVAGAQMVPHLGALCKRWL
jgi:hypothetical protein